MTTTNSYSRQPTKLDYASPTQFKFSIIKLPKVEFFVTDINLPGIELTSLTQNTTLKQIPIPGNDLQYDPLSLSFMVDENFENYQEIHGWLVGLGYPRDNSEFRNLAQSANDRFPNSSQSVSTEIGKVKYKAAQAGGTYSDATLTTLTSKNNSQLEVRFRDIYPTKLSGLSFTQQAGDIQYLTATVDFNYLVYDFATVGNSRTSVTTS
jgi:hypothetical protein|tara:strand:+ start:5669 stop:6292 length:624 start_codon:yes stop_codon:yes gene_type:complete